VSRASHLALVLGLAVQLPLIAQTPAKMQEQQVRLVTQTTGGPMRQVDVTSDGRRALTLEANILRVWDLEAGREWQRVRPRFDRATNGPETFFAFWVLPDNHLAIDIGSHIVLHDVETGSELRRCELDDTSRRTEPATTFVRKAASPISQEMAIAGREGIEVLDLASCRRTRRQTENQVTAIAWTRDGSGLIATIGGRPPAIEVWGRNDRKPRHRRVLESPAGALATSADGRVAIGGADGTLVIATIAGTTATIDRSLKSDRGPIGAVEWLDQRRVLVRHAGEPKVTRDAWPDRTVTVGRVLVWDVVTGEAKPVGPTAYRAARSIPGRGAVLVGDDRSVQLIDLASGRTLVVLQGSARGVTSATFLADGSGNVTVLDDGSVRFWPVDGSPTLTASPIASRPGIDNISVSPGEPFITDAGSSFQLWSRISGQKPRPFGPAGNYHVVQWSRDGSRVLLAAGMPGYGYEVWDTIANKILCAVDGDQRPIVVPALSPDGRRLASVSTSSSRTPPRGVIRDVESCTEIGSFLASLDGLGSRAGFSRDTRLLYIDDSEGVAIWDMANERRGSTLRVEHALPTGVAITPDNRTLATVSGDGRLLLWSLPDGKRLGAIDTGMAETHTLDVSPDGRHLLTASAEGRVALISLQSRTVVANLVSLSDGSWTVTDARGRYDASDPNRTAGLHWIIGRDVVGIDQLPAQRFYIPHLLSTVLGNRPLPAENVALSQLESAPTVTVSDLKPGAREVQVTLTNRGGGLGPVKVWVNGRQLAGEFKPPSASASTVALSIPLADAVYRSTGPNQIDVVAYSTRDRVASPVRGLLVPAVSSSPAKSTTRLFGVFVGTSSFRNNTLNLRFAAKDAADMASAVRLGASRFLGAERVQIQVLTSDASADSRPTKTNIQRAFAAVAKAASPEDVVLVYFAGHGVAHGVDQYFYLTEDANSIELADERSRVANTISSDELQRWLQTEVKALKQIVILDTCAAGAASAGLRQLAVKRTLSAEQIRALAFLQKATGSFILMGSAADRVSYEASEYGQGLLTYALLGALSGEIRELQNGQELWVDAWLNHAEQRVPRLAEGIGGIQVPSFIRPAGNDFPLMSLTPDVKQAIPIAQPKPRILQPLIVDENFGDNVPLLTAVRQRLRQLGEPASRGDAAGAGRIVYLDGVTGEVPRAMVPRVRCEKTGGGLRATIGLWRDNTQVWSSSTPLVLPADVEQAARLLADEIVRATLSIKKPA
jgi:WD40 repeat protein